MHSRQTHYHFFGLGRIQFHAQPREPRLKYQFYSEAVSYYFPGCRKRNISIGPSITSKCQHYISNAGPHNTCIRNEEQRAKSITLRNPKRHMGRQAWTRCCLPVMYSVKIFKTLPPTPTDYTLKINVIKSVKTALKSTKTSLDSWALPKANNSSCANICNIPLTEYLERNIQKQM